MKYRLEQLEVNKTNEEEEKTKKIFVLVGPPSVGKSTWISNTFSDFDPYVISRDDIAEAVAGTREWTYDDMFVPPPKDSKLGDEDPKYGTVVQSPKWMSWQPLSFDKVLEANNEVQSRFMQRVAGAKGNSLIVVDMTNMNASSRAAALKAIDGNQDEYKKIAVVFEFEGAEELVQKIARKRAEAAKRMGKAKTVPPAAIQRMFSAFERPSMSEGFDEIVTVDNRDKMIQWAADTVSESIVFSSERFKRLLNG